MDRMAEFREKLSQCGHQMDFAALQKQYPDCFAKLAELQARPACNSDASKSIEPA